MSGNSIYTIKKGTMEHMEQVTVPDYKSAQDLMYALNVLDCFEPIAKQQISGNRQELQLFEVCFLDRCIRVVGMNDAERVAHWMMVYGCRKISIEKISQEKEDVSD